MTQIIGKKQRRVNNYYSRKFVLAYAHIYCAWKISLLILVNDLKFMNIDLFGFEGNIPFVDMLQKIDKSFKMSGIIGITTFIFL